MGNHLKVNVLILGQFGQIEYVKKTILFGNLGTTLTRKINFHFRVRW